MKAISFHPAVRMLLPLAALVFCGTALAQYVWINESGVRQYSDIAPPASVPANRILKAPGRPAAAEVPSPAAKSIGSDAAAGTTPASVSGSASGSASAAAKAPMTTAERNADYNKRRAEQAEKDKKAEDARQLASDTAKACDQTRSYQRTLQGGERISRVNARGERYFLSDAQRARELQEASRTLQDCK